MKWNEWLSLGADLLSLVAFAVAIWQLVLTYRLFHQFTKTSYWEKNIEEHIEEFEQIIKRMDKRRWEKIVPELEGKLDGIATYITSDMKKTYTSLLEQLSKEEKSYELILINTTKFHIRLKEKSRELKTPLLK